jgi:excisionase family DNA binding protein
MNAPVVMPDGERLFRIKEAAALLRMSDKTIRRMIDSGQLQSWKPRGIRLIRWSHLRRVIPDPTEGGNNESERQKT